MGVVVRRRLMGGEHTRAVFDGRAPWGRACGEVTIHSIHATIVTVRAMQGAVRPTASAAAAAAAAIAEVVARLPRPLTSTAREECARTAKRVHDLNQQGARRNAKWVEGECRSSGALASRRVASRPRDERLCKKTEGKSRKYSRPTD